MFEESFRRVVAQLSQKNLVGQNETFIKQFGLVELEKIKECQKLMNEMKKKEEFLKSIYEYKQPDRENLVQILGCEIVRLPLNKGNKFQDNVDAKRKILDALGMVIYANEKLKNIELARMEYLENIKESIHIEIKLLEEKQKKLKVLYRIILI